MPTRHQRGANAGELFGSAKSHTSTIELNPAEALLAISLLATAADDNLSEGEKGVLSSNQVRIFNSYSKQQRQEILNKVFSLIEQHSSSAVFAAAKNALTPRLRLTAFAIAVDLVLADGVSTNEEEDFLNQLWQALGIPATDGKKILDVMTLKNCVY